MFTVDLLEDQSVIATVWKRKCILHLEKHVDEKESVPLMSLESKQNDGAIKLILSKHTEFNSREVSILS